MRIVEADSVSKRFVLRRNQLNSLKERALSLFHARLREERETFWALRDVSLPIDRGESIGLIGRNGSGKSTFLKLISGTYLPTVGRLRIRRGLQIGSMIDLGVGFHPELSGRENVHLNASIHGLSRAEVAAIYGSIVRYAELGDFMEEPLKNYSSGMSMRLGFAVAAHLRPDLLLLDEVFAVGDEDFQRKCLRTLNEHKERGTTFLFVSHASAAVRSICDRVCLLDHGRLMFDGGVDEGLAEYQRLMLAGSGHAAPGPAEDGATSAAEPPDLELSWHREAVGGRWETAGQAQFEFLRSQGLEPAHRVLDVGCGSFRAGIHLARYLEPGHYWGIDANPDLVRAGAEIELPRAGLSADRVHVVINDAFDLSAVPARFEFALAHALFSQLPLNKIARCIASVVGSLAAGGRLFVTFYENERPGAFEPVVHGDGTTTYPDAPPFHYDYPTLERICEVLGADALYVGPWAAESHERMMVITKARPGR